MKFEIEYKNLKFEVLLEVESFDDPSLMIKDKFNKIPNQTMIEIKKGNLFSYNVLITSANSHSSYTHYLNGVLLTSKPDELANELGDYLEQENILDKIFELRRLYEIEPGPHWKI